MTTETALRFRSTSREDSIRIVRELERQAATKHDIVAAGRDITLLPDARIGIAGGEPLGTVAYGGTKHAHRQIADKADIPGAYYERMREKAPGLLAENVNHWLPQTGRNYLVRTLDGNVRALLSDRFRLIDNIDLFFAGAKKAQQVGAEVSELELSETHFYMKLLHPEWRERIEYQKGQGLIGHSTDGIDEDGGDWLVPGVLMRNSEVGLGQFTGEFFIKRLSCMNGMTTDIQLAKRHVGGQHEVGVITSAQTRELMDRLIWSEIDDLVNAAFDREFFQRYVARLNDAAAEELGRPADAVAAVVQHYGMSDEDKQTILNELMAPSRGLDPGRTVWGMMNAITACAREKDDPEEELALMRIGGRLLDDRAKIPNLSIRN